MPDRSISGEFAPTPEREAELVERNMARLRQRVSDRVVADEVIYATAIATAGTVQALVAEAGTFEAVREHDLAAAWRASRAAQPETGRTVCEHPSALTEFTGRWDVAVLEGRSGRPVEVAEMKWDRRKKLYEVLWDTIKIATAIASNRDDHGALERGLVVAAAPTFRDLGDDLQPIVETGAWSAGALVSDRPQIWSWAHDSTTPPSQVPAGVALRREVSAPILAPIDGAAPWELRVLEVSVTDPTFVAVED